jgi:hypothetical protein
VFAVCITGCVFSLTSTASCIFPSFSSESFKSCYRLSCFYLGLTLDRSQGSAAPIVTCSQISKVPSTLTDLKYLYFDVVHTVQFLII